jgi:protein-tyrosine phosphatase
MHRLHLPAPVDKGINRMNGEQSHLSNLTDRHCHLLPGLDDGPASTVAALEMGRTLAATGFSRIYCTPHHFKGLYENSPDRVRTAVASLQRAFEAAAIAIRLFPAMEYRLDGHLMELLDEPLLVDDRTVLVEAPMEMTGRPLLDALTGIVAVKGLRPLLAHPERCEAFALNEERKDLFRLFRRSFTAGDERLSILDLVGALRDQGCRLQGNVGSLAGKYGETVKQRAFFMLRHGLYDCFGSDAHPTPHLKQWLNHGLEQLRREPGGDAARYFPPHL